ncbi:hypothetical protein B0H17DRAFT_1148583 [Mycena rosella]|uniref:Uncharacterized protein n=1 Tax=Mycena rosella TaxID=1033263 RepID=A0AAD7C9X9_MYCRO|nr:hypothetical protein B0H17DRAFT_1148583 [Mycena rosella]
MNLHKETFEPMLLHLFKQTSTLRIKDVWYIGTAADYSRAVHSFLTSTVHGTDFAKRKLIGVAHSAAAASLLLIPDEWPKISFHGLIFLDPAILYGGKESQILCELFANWAKSKPHTWDSRDATLSQLSRTAFKRWDPLGTRITHRHERFLCDIGMLAGPRSNLVGRPFEMFTQLTAAEKLPIHLIICPNDEYK